MVVEELVDTPVTEATVGVGTMLVGMGLLEETGLAVELAEVEEAVDTRQAGQKVGLAADRVVVLDCLALGQMELEVLVELGKAILPCLPAVMAMAGLEGTVVGLEETTVVVAKVVEPTSFLAVQRKLVQQTVALALSALSGALVALIRLTPQTSN